MSEDKFLLVKGRAGLGNRILCLLSAILYARFTGRRLIVDWSDDAYSNDGSNVFSSLFHCPLSGQLDEIPDTDSVRPGIWRGHLHESALNMILLYPEASMRYPETWRAFSVDLSRLDYPEDVLVMWSYVEQVYIMRRHFKGSYQELSKLGTKAILRSVLQDNLKPHSLIQKRVNQFKLKRFNQKTVGVHVRYMDKKARISAILGKLEALIRREPELQIFLATDNLEIEKRFLDKYQNVISTEKWYPSSGKSMHRNPESPDRLMHGIEALVDLYLLASCDYLILDESSSFSYVASLITNTPNSNIFNVQLGHMIPPEVRHQIWSLKIRLQWSLRKLGLAK